MGTQEYVLRGTIDGMVKILKNDFDVTPHEAKFMVYFLANKNNTHDIPEEELNLWYLDNEEAYKGQILNKHLAINFTNVQKSLMHKAYIFLTNFIFGRGIDLVLLGIDLAYIICSAIEKIDDFDYCVFARIIEFNTVNKNHMFKPCDITTANQDGKCDYQESDWSCTHFAKDENCTNNEEKTRASLKRLEEQNIIKEVGKHWILL